MALTLGINAYWQPEKMFRMLDVTGYDYKDRLVRFKLAIFTFVYVCITCLVMIFGIIQPMKKYLNRDRPAYRKEMRRLKDLRSREKE